MVLDSWKAGTGCKARVACATCKAAASAVRAKRARRAQERQASAGKYAGLMQSHLGRGACWAADWSLLVSDAGARQQWFQRWWRACDMCNDCWSLPGGEGTVFCISVFEAALSARPRESCLSAGTASPTWAGALWMLPCALVSCACRRRDEPHCSQLGHALASGLPAMLLQCASCSIHLGGPRQPSSIIG